MATTQSPPPSRPLPEPRVIVHPAGEFPRGKTPPSEPGVTGITPDEMQLVRKRQRWRARVLKICIDTLEHLDPKALGIKPGTHEELTQVSQRFSQISDHVRTDMQRLLESEMLVPSLESHRHAANYFLDTLIGYARKRAEACNREQGKSVESPLEALPAHEFDAFVHAGLRQSTDAIAVFLKHLIGLEEFDLEVRRQRKRLQYLLGSDRNLRDLAESNSEIIDASLDQFESIVERFFATCHSILHDLAPLLDISSPFPKLEQELSGAREQLKQLKADVFVPLEDLRAQVDRFDSAFKPLDTDLDALLQRSAELRRFKFGENLGAGSAEGSISILPVLKLRTTLSNFQAALQVVAFDRCAEINAFLSSDPHDDLKEEIGQVQEGVEGLGQLVTTARYDVLDRTLSVLRQVEIINQSLDVEALKSSLVDLRSFLDTLVEDHLLPISRAVYELRQKNVLPLKRRICQEMGLIRTAFLQPCFAHIAADDPRSLHTPQYFYFKEFADEAKRSQQLLERIHGLWQYMEQLQTTKIQGLRFTPNNLNKIAKRVLLERRTVPSGPGWRELERFLQCLKDDLVAKIEGACALPGVRFDDRNQLSAYGDRITEDCAMLLAKRETAYKLIKEVDRMSQEEGQEAHDRYRTLILRVTCQDMGVKLRSISQTLLEMIPYVGAMVGGIRMRTSLSFVED